MAGQNRAREPEKKKGMFGELPTLQLPALQLNCASEFKILN
jgi:hypothetical protein